MNIRDAVVRWWLGVGRGKVRCPCCGKWMGHTKVLKKPRRELSEAEKTIDNYFRDQIKNLPDGDLVKFKMFNESTASVVEPGGLAGGNMPSVDSGWSGFVADAEKPAGIDPFAIPEAKKEEVK